MIKKIINKLPKKVLDDVHSIEWADSDLIELNIDKFDNDSGCTTFCFQIQVDDRIISDVRCVVSQSFEGHKYDFVDLDQDDIKFIEKIIDLLCPICFECLTRPGHYISHELLGVYCEECAKALAEREHASFFLD